MIRPSDTYLPANKMLAKFMGLVHPSLDRMNYHSDYTKLKDVADKIYEMYSTGNHGVSEILYEEIFGTSIVDDHIVLYDRVVAWVDAYYFAKEEYKWEVLIEESYGPIEIAEPIWVPIAYSAIRDKYKIPQYIKNGILRKIEE